MERKLNSTFVNSDGILLKVAKSPKKEQCVGCYFFVEKEADCGDAHLLLGYCSEEYREDDQDIIFIKTKPTAFKRFCTNIGNLFIYATHLFSK